MVRMVSRACLPERVTTTVAASAASAETSSRITCEMLGWPSFLRSIIEKATSSAVSGVPSWKRASGRRWKVKTFPSSDTSTERATSP